MKPKVDPTHITIMREAGGKTQEEAASLVHVAVRTWQRYEDGTKEIPEGVIHLFCLLTGLDYEKFKGKEAKSS